ncbi:non-ribosomal peptide synthetase [Plantactinospora sp. KBS50]|uniref:non-ribosomal peptide synthetase n=1 Tax=Plantactinospora sp. KBS50 TaxID=2024580 RepID=UPI000BAAF442|nr:non-ribosomal peptide synthetase [Plantactinospora sp. KBS50]ASW55341.1 hypothetical protein CIK06_15945 [Plantactinospora sp. KBS50]
MSKGGERIPRPGVLDRFAALDGAQRVRLLRRLVEAGRLDEIPAVVPPRHAGDPVRPSLAQEDLWVFASLHPGTAALNLCCAYHFAQPVDVADLERALTIVQGNHDILRMRITGPVDDLRLDFPPADAFRLERLDLRDLGVTLDEALAAFSRRPFDLGRDRPIRGAFITVDERRRALVLALHHIATDWWSFDVLHLEFVEAYQAVRAGAAPPRGRPAIQYADFAAWQRELAMAGVFEAQLTFWRHHLAEPPEPLTVGPLTTVGPTSVGPTSVGPPAVGHASADAVGPTAAEAVGPEPAPPAGPGIAQVPFHLDAELADRVRAFAREHGSTVYAVLMTAFAVFAHRLSGRSDLVLGTPMANRSARGLERVIGYVMNAVPTRWRIGPTATFAGLLGGFSAEFPRLSGNADVPVGRIVTAVGVERLPGRSPLFQWVFMYLPRQESVRALREISEPRRVHTGGEHDVVGIVREVDDGLDGTLEVRTDVYPAGVVRRWADTVAVLLAGLLAAPDVPVGAIALLTPEQERRLLAAAGDTAAPPSEPPSEPPPASLADLVARRAAETPHAVAVEADGGSLTYAGLIGAADRLAERLAGYGVGPDRVVALALGRTAAMVVALLAVQRAGGAYLPIDLDYPADRIRYMLDDADPVLVVTDPATAAALPGTGTPRLLIDPAVLDDPHDPAGSNGRADPAAPADPVDGPGPAGGRGTDPDRAGYLMYTSGSAGRPKGVLVSHAGIASLTEAFVRRFGLDRQSRILQLSSPSFDISVGELCMAFGSGGTLVIPPPGPLAGPALGDVLAQRRITCTLLPPAVLASVPPGAYPWLRTVCVGADVCPPDVVTAWATAGRRFHNAYGPTETTVGVTVSDPLAGGTGAPPIGRPITGTRAYVLDDRLRPVPVGVPGELYLGGAGVARGYHGRPGLTAGRFVADPYPARPGARMYRTGDLVRWREDGQLDFLCRTDEQVKLRGFRIETAEIEAVLAEHDEVARAVVLLREDAPGDRRLVAYLVPAGGAAPHPDTLRAHAAALLPRQMVPSVFVTVDTVPVTAQGKVDRRALPAPVAPARPATAGPGTERERLFCALFRAALGRPEVGVRDDFFALGGDSIGAILLVGRARTAGLELELTDVFAGRTPAGLAAIARTAPAPSAEPDGAATGRFPPTPIMRWWWEHTAAPDAFTLSAVLPIPAGARADRIAEALRTLTRRHGTLRQRIVRSTPRDWELEIPPPGPVPVELTRVDATALAPDGLPAAVRAAAGRLRLAPEAGRMLAAVWFDRGARQDGRLLLTVHHLAADAVSLHLLRRELADLLSAGPADAGPSGTGPSGNGRTDGPAAGTPFRRWAGLLAERSGEVVADLPHWRDALSGPQDRLIPGTGPPAGPTPTPTPTPAGGRAAGAGPVARPQREGATGRRATLTVRLAPADTEPVLTAAPAAFRCGPDEVLLTALLAAALRWRGHGSGLLVDREVHGRETFGTGLDLSTTVGWFTSRFPVRLDAGDAAAEAFWQDGEVAAAALKRVKEQLRAIPSGGLSYGLLRHLNPDTAPSLADLPGPDVGFNYLGRTAAPDTGEFLGVLDADAVPLAHAVELDAVAEVRADGPHLVTTWSYDAGLLTEARVRDLAGHWSAALRRLAAAAAAGAGGATASDFPLVDLSQDQIESLESDLDGFDWAAGDAG